LNRFFELLSLRSLPPDINLSFTMGLDGVVPCGVLTGDNLLKLMRHCSDNAIALPAFNCTSSSTLNAILQAARDIKSPVIIQFSNGGAAFYAGKGISNEGQKASVLGAVAGAHHVRMMAKHYGVPVVLHSDHCAKKLLPWFDGMLDADEEYFKIHGEPLFSSHMLDLSEEKDGENIETCVKYFERMTKINQMLEMEIGITGGEEDGVDNSGKSADELYTTPEQVYRVYEALSKIGPMFSIAAAFGNVHGVYKPGNVTLSPHLLGNHQKFIKEKIGSDRDKPAFLVMHGGSGSTDAEIGEAVANGVIKMNIDTDTQWAYWEGLKNFYEDKKEYLQAQVGNPEGADKPNKKYYDPRVWVRKSEESMMARAKKSFVSLNAENVLGDNWDKQ
jgi:fructose-bisphosphate aldolase class II